MKLRTPSQILQLFKLSDFVCLDFETTGLDPQNSVIIEAAAVKIKGGKVTDKYQSLVSFDCELPEATNEDACRAANYCYFKDTEPELMQWFEKND